MWAVSPACRLPPFGLNLSAQAEALDQRPVLVDVRPLHVFEQAAAPPDHPQEATTGVVVFLVDLEVLGELVDALRQQGDLNVGGTGVRVVPAEVFDDLLLVVPGEDHPVEAITRGSRSPCRPRPGPGCAGRLPSSGGPGRRGSRNAPRP